MNPHHSSAPTQGALARQAGESPLAAAGLAHLGKGAVAGRNACACGRDGRRPRVW
eukprot:CAMPEP_0196756050 /NCGR_PEP_ID=MMETSP1091-20130531/99698_1 /TAXON_ID=302021 /ORGANISM="Rhodomonas sp., Strain CCMP768" /LENGTH=54 /DNA_ID=CAMNT_0042104601 /DNA_START=159 /DNA_END=320 /DNA_ORIENTATION=-